MARSAKPTTQKTMKKSPTPSASFPTQAQVVVIGGGVIGCEYASIFAHIGVKVTIVDSRERLLSFLDNEMAAALTYLMRKYRISLVLGDGDSEIYQEDGQVVTVTKSEIVITFTLRCKRFCGIAVTGEKRMGFELDVFGDEQLDAEFFGWLVDDHSVDVHRHFSRLWEYYANPSYEVGQRSAADRKVAETGRRYVQAQEYGLPSRITGLSYSLDAGGSSAVRDVQRKEVVIENDIAWRINAAVDFLFGKPVSFVSKSPDGRKRTEIEQLIKGVFEANGDAGFFQDMAVLGGVYGFVDCIVRPGEQITDCISTSFHNLPLEGVVRLARSIDLELVEAPRALPVLEENDYRTIRYYVQHFHQKRNSVSRKNSFLSRLLSGEKGGGDRREVAGVTEIMSSQAWQRYENGELAAEGEMPWGFLPVVHIQNVAQPYYYEGISDVGPLVSLQDELNTRLSDRASRITFQSFKMYLGKGVEGFDERPVSPGRMWYTDNPDATIEEFGGDSEAPSEESHIAEIREALDKSSGVTPVVAGILKNKVGNLTSVVALRLTLMGMLSKNERKRFTYSAGLKRLCWMVLEMLDKAGVYKTSEADRELDVIFPSPLPENLMEKLREAQIKKELGVPAEQVLRELGYEAKDVQAGSQEAL